LPLSEKQGVGSSILPLATKILMKLLEYILDFYIIFLHNKKLIKKLDTKKFNTIIDIGAHKLELFTSLKKFNYEFDQYIAFEPEKNLFNGLMQKYNFEEKTKLYNLAIGNVNKEEKLFLNTFSSLHTFSEINPDLFKYKIKNYISKLFRKNEILTQNVDVVKLDNFINKIDKPVSVIKIDTEGYEKQVLEGATEFFLEHNPSYLIIEFQNENNYKNYYPNEIEKLIYKLGYKKVFELFGPFKLFKDIIYIKSYK